LEDKDINGSIILQWILGATGCNDMDCTDLFQVTDRSLALVNRVMNTGVPENAAIS
jgi:hypothetical protein